MIVICDKCFRAGISNTDDDTKLKQAGWTIMKFTIYAICPDCKEK